MNATEQRNACRAFQGWLAAQQTDVFTVMTGLDYFMAGWGAHGLIAGTIKAPGRPRTKAKAPPVAATRTQRTMPAKDAAGRFVKAAPA